MGGVELEAVDLDADQHDSLVTVMRWAYYKPFFNDNATITR